MKIYNQKIRDRLTQYAWEWYYEQQEKRERKKQNRF
jgi:hypothetical protein